MTGAKQTFLFGSRARGDYRKNSDIDLLVIIENEPTEEIHQGARRVQEELMPEASGINIISMSETEFLSRIHLRNNMANTIIKEGCPVMSDGNLKYHTEYGDEEVDWDDVEKKINDAAGAASWIETILQAGILEAGDDNQFGQVAQNTLESDIRRS